MRLNLYKDTSLDLPNTNINIYKDIILSNMFCKFVILFSIFNISTLQLTWIQHTLEMFLPDFLQQAILQKKSDIIFPVAFITIPQKWLDHKTNQQCRISWKYSQLGKIQEISLLYTFAYSWLKNFTWIIKCGWRVREICWRNITVLHKILVVVEPHAVIAVLARTELWTEIW